MGGKSKLKRFDDITRLENVFEFTDFENNPAPQGRWAEKVFGNNNPVVLELACGKGEYTVSLAEKFPDKNFLGVDIKGARIWVGAKKAIENKLDNVRFLRTSIDFIDRYLGPDEISEIWITFPDPYPGKPGKRLTSPKFLNLYRKIAKPDCLIRLKTDSEILWNYTTEILRQEGLKITDKTDDIYADRPGDPLLTIQTGFEKKHLSRGKKIQYISFRLNG